ncbi:MAG: RNA polymerase sigma factor [Bacteroidaceae bacterium]|nr:RNA polymerase sigma factor [Bacteroidaceae bacterium]
MDLRTDILPHRDRLYRLALSITLHTAEAEDVVQDTMLRAWERREEWPKIQNMAAWLSQICRNLALDRRKRLERITSLSSDDHHEGTTMLPLMSLPAEQETDGTAALVARLINQLPSPQNDIMQLRDVEGLSYKEIAAELQLTETQVKVYLHRARQKLREHYLRLQQHGL